nr:hypothetical protein [Tianweitania aestuarii]
MLSSIRAALARAAELIGHLIGRLLALVAWPFVALGRWLGGRSWIIKAPFALVVVLLVGLYGYFLWNTQVWSNFDPDYAARYASAQTSDPTSTTSPTGTTVPASDAGQAPATAPEATERRCRQPAGVGC